MIFIINPCMFDMPHALSKQWPLITCSCCVKTGEIRCAAEDEKREKGRCLGFNWEASGSGKEIFVRHLIRRKLHPCHKTAWRQLGHWAIQGVPLSDDVRVKEIKVNASWSEMARRYDAWWFLRHFEKHSIKNPYQLFSILQKICIFVFCCLYKDAAVNMSKNHRCRAICRGAPVIQKSV